MSNAGPEFVASRGVPDYERAIGAAGRDEVAVVAPGEASDDGGMNLSAHEHAAGHSMSGARRVGSAMDGLLPRQRIVASICLGT